MLPENRANFTGMKWLTSLFVAAAIATAGGAEFGRFRGRCRGQTAS